MKFFSLPQDKIIQFLKKYGENSNSFLTGYHGFQQFTLPTDNEGTQGYIGFVRTENALVGAAEPLCAPEKKAEFLKEFALEAQSENRVAMLLPVNESTWVEAERQGYGRVYIGAEPVFHLPKYTPDVEKIPTALKLRNQGAEVFEFSINSVDQSTLNEINGITKEWLSTRKTLPLGFVNKVKPWELGEHKKYFGIRVNGQIIAYLAMIPAMATNSWYFIDLIKKKNTPAGTTELLMLEAMKKLKSENQNLVSLGVSPLSLMDLAPKNEKPILYSLLRLTYEWGGFFYNFKPLFQFKCKFSPSGYRPVYMIYFPKHFRFKHLRGLLSAFFEKGTIRSMRTGVTKWVRGFDLYDMLSPQLSKNWIPLPPAQSQDSATERVKTSIAGACFVILTAILADRVNYQPLYIGLSLSALFISLAVSLESLLGTLILIACVGPQSLAAVLIARNFIEVPQHIGIHYFFHAFYYITWCLLGISLKIARKNLINAAIFSAVAALLVLIFPKEIPYSVLAFLSSYLSLQSVLAYPRRNLL